RPRRRNAGRRQQRAAGLRLPAGGCDDGRHGHLDDAGGMTRTDAKKTPRIRWKGGGARLSEPHRHGSLAMRISTAVVIAILSGLAPGARAADPAPKAAAPSAAQ